MNHDMSRSALDDGPDEPAPVRCPDCRGHGVVAAGSFAPRNTRDCDRCAGEGEIDRDALEDDQ